MHLFPPHWIPSELQPFATLGLTWGIACYLLSLVPPAKHREHVTFFAAVGFASYWMGFAVGLDLGRFEPFFGMGGIGDEAFFAALMLAVSHSFLLVEERLYRRLVYVGRLDITFPKDGPHLARRPPLIETSGIAKPRPIDE